MVQKLKSLKLWRKQETILKEKEKIKKDVCLSILEKELRIIKQTRRENSRKIDKYGSIKKKFQNSDTTYAL